MTGIPLNAAVATYDTNPNNAAGIENFTGTGCTNGVFTRTASNGDLFRLNVTSGGTFILDLPAGSGGILSFKTTNAAAISDLASRNWWGLSFPDNGGPELLNVTSGALAAGAVPFSGNTMNSSVSGSFIPATGGAALTPSNKLDAPAAYTSSNNALVGTYAAPKDIPGLIQIANQNGEANIVAIASKAGNQVMMFGVVYNYRTQSGAGCSAGSLNCLLRNTGNFIVFSH